MCPGIYNDSRVERTTRGARLRDVGFNPFRTRQRNLADYVMVVSALVVLAALVIWALVG